jgi:hypothetical protein
VQSIELQFLLLLGVRAFATRDSHVPFQKGAIIDNYRAFLDKELGESSMYAAGRGLPVERVVELLGTYRHLVSLSEVLERRPTF